MVLTGTQFGKFNAKKKMTIGEDKEKGKVEAKRVLLGQTQALGSRPKPQPAYAGVPGPIARLEFQSVSPEASLFFS
jgi:hypothetical protein